MRELPGRCAARPMDGYVRDRPEAAPALPLRSSLGTRRRRQTGRRAGRRCPGGPPSTTPTGHPVRITWCRIEQPPITLSHKDCSREGGIRTLDGRNRPYRFSRPVFRPSGMSRFPASSLIAPMVVGKGLGKKQVLMCTHTRRTLLSEISSTVGGSAGQRCHLFGGAHPAHWPGVAARDRRRSVTPTSLGSDLESSHSGRPSQRRRPPDRALG
jgi:hypothetical protein